MRESLNMILVLTVICALSGLVLSGVKSATREQIVEQEMTYVQGPAIKAVFGPHDNDPIKDRKTFDLPGGETAVVFPSIRDGKLEAVAIEAAAKGYGGDLGVMVGFDANGGGLTGIGITTMKETPGVGTNVAGYAFTSQFQGHPLADIQLASKGGDIDGVAGATYSSTGAVNAVRKASAIFNEIRPKLQAAWGSGS